VTIELGGKAGIVAADDLMCGYLARRGVVAPTPVLSDPDTVYSDLIVDDAPALGGIRGEGKMDSCFCVDGCRVKYGNLAVILADQQHDFRAS